MPTPPPGKKGALSKLENDSMAVKTRTPLHNKIKALTGHSTSHFIKKVRIHQATRLLRTSEMNISQVAFEVGVESLSYFTKIFTKEMGLSPSKYRGKLHMEQ